MGGDSFGGRVGVLVTFAEMTLVAVVQQLRACSTSSLVGGRVGGWRGQHAVPDALPGGGKLRQTALRLCCGESGAGRAWMHPLCRPVRTCTPCCGAHEFRVDTATSTTGSKASQSRSTEPQPLPPCPQVRTASPPASCCAWWRGPTSSPPTACTPQWASGRVSCARFCLYCL